MSQAKIQISRRDCMVLLEAVDRAIENAESLIQNSTRPDGTVPVEYRAANTADRRCLRRWDAVRDKLRKASEVPHE